MKVFLIMLMMTALLCGCGAKETGETIGEDAYVESVMAEPQEVFVELPGEAAVPTMENGSSRYYICEGYEITLDTVPSGDVKTAIETLSGYDPKDLTVMETEKDGVKRYDFVWASQGETGERLGRASILDDGNYLYTLSVLRDADTTEDSQIVWRSVFESFSLV